MKKSGAFKSLIRGVSEQVPHARIEGQQWAQDNFLSDPVQGLARRHGSIMQDEVDVTATVGTSINAATAADIAAFQVQEVTQQGVPLSIIYRQAEKPAGSTAPGIICVNADSRSLVPVAFDPLDTVAADAVDGGIQSITTAGRFVLLAPRAMSTSVTTNANWASKSLGAGLRNDLCAAAWVRGGSYSRTYSIRANIKTPASAEYLVTASYKTMPAAYPGILDTTAISSYKPDPAGGTTTDTVTMRISANVTILVELRAYYVNTVTVHELVPGPGADILFTQVVGAPAAGEYSVTNGVYTFNAADVGKDVIIKYTHDKVVDNKDYQKQINTITEAYTTAVNQHIAAAAEDIAPESIAQKLVDALNAAAALTAHPNANPFSRDGSHIRSADCSGLAVDDGGTGDFFRGAAQEINALEKLTDRHYFGKIVRITPRTGGLSYYLKATPKLTEAGAVFGEVVWKECAGVEYVPVFMFLLGTVVSGTLYVASTPALLTALSGIPVPDYPASRAGDADTSAPFAFFGNRITHMTMFKDRLIIVSGGVHAMSASGDYFNFFRESALTLLESDPIEVFAVGREDDVITSSALMDGALVFFGQRAQYLLSGRDVLKPGNAHVDVVGTSQGTNAIPPAATGNTLFFTQPNDGKITVHQFNTGAFEGTLEPAEISAHLDSYFAGAPTQVLALSAPSQVFMRTTGLSNGMYVYSYIDSARDGRLFDSWSRWTWSARLGSLAGITASRGDVLAVYLREGVGDTTWLVLDLFKREAAPSLNPHLDSLRAYTAVGSIAPTWPGAPTTAAAFNKSGGDVFLIGRSIADIGRLVADYPDSLDALMVGTRFPAEVALTAPYVRDREGRAQLNSSLTLTTLAITVANSVALRAYLTDLAGANRSEIESWVYRPLNQWVLNTQPVAKNALVDVSPMADVSESIVVIAARDWFPLTLTAIEWTGQFFTQRR